jgi:selenocysteine lyase/cysteine desulfurase
LLGAFQEMQERLQGVRDSVGRFIGARGAEIALTGCTSDGINIVGHGLGLGSGDHVLISSEEHESGIWPWIAMEASRGIALNKFEVAHDPQATLATFTEALNEKTRLVAVSHVTNLAGAVLPVREMCALARDRGIPTLVDGAQSVGQTPIDVGEIGCDFLAGCGHKWLMGPLGTGFVFVRGESLRKLDVSWVGWGADWGHDLFSEEEFILAETAQRFEFGTRAWPVLMALGTAVEFIERLGIEEICERTRDLAARLRDRLGELSNVELVTPDPQTGIVAFRVKGRDLRETLTRLWQEDRIALRQAPRYGGIRASVAFCNTEDDVEALVEALNKLR